MKVLNDTIMSRIFFQDMAVGNDLEFLLFVVISDSPTRQGIAVQIIKIGILLLQFGPKFVVLARVRPDSTGRFDIVEAGAVSATIRPLIR